MLRKQAFCGAFALLVTVFSGMGPAAAQDADVAAAAATPPTDAPQYIKGWEPKDTDAAQQDPDAGDIADTFQAKHKSATAAPVVGAMHRAA
ncbi:MAG: hypothetical protein ABI082_00740, partial [Dokdonella sp.]